MGNNRILKFSLFVILSSIFYTAGAQTPVVIDGRPSYRNHEPYFNIYNLPNFTGNYQYKLNGVQLPLYVEKWPLYYTDAASIQNATQTVGFDKVGWINGKYYLKSDLGRIVFYAGMNTDQEIDNNCQNSYRLEMSNVSAGSPNLFYSEQLTVQDVVMSPNGLAFMAKGINTSNDRKPVFAVIDNLNSNGFIGDFNVKTFEKDRYCASWFGCRCGESGYNKQLDVDFCRLQTNGGTLGRLTTNSNGTLATNNEYINLNSTGSSTVPLYWVNQVNYCYESIDHYEYRIKSYGSTTYTNAYTNSANGLTFTSGVTNIGSITLDKGFGSYIIESVAKDKFGNTFTVPDIKIELKPSCNYGVDPQIRIINRNTGVAVAAVNGGYNGAPSTDPQVLPGGYTLERAEDYILDVNYKTPGADGNDRAIPDFNSFYGLFANNLLYNNTQYWPVPNVGIQFDWPPGLTPPTEYNRKPGQYGFRIVQNPPLELNIPVESKFTGAGCYQYKAINISIGGQNASAYEPCLIYIPRDLPTLFPGITTTWGNKHYLSYFTFKVTSGKGIIITPQADGDGVFLKDGAQLIATVLPLPNSPELADDVLNWSQETSYDESGRIIAESKQFLDKSGNPTQLQWKNISDHVVMATQNLYDVFGRPAIQTLPAPVSTNKTFNKDQCGSEVNMGQDLFFKYNASFIKNGNHQAYTFFDFDNFTPTNSSNSIYTNPVSNLNNPNQVLDDAPGTLGWYYGDNNKIGGAGINTYYGHELMVEPGVAKTFYPYSRRIYHTDGTSRVKGVTLPGNQHRPGAEGTGVPRYTTHDLVGVDNTTDASIITDYLSIRNTHVLSDAINLKPTDLNNKITKSVTNLVDGNVDYTYETLDGLPIITYHPASTKRTYNFYNTKGQLVCTVSPLGVKQLIDNPSTAWTNVDRNEFSYDIKGRLISTYNPDEGITYTKYQKDGRIRFSENALQRTNGNYTYFNYDDQDRLVEKGIFTPLGASGTQDLRFTSATLKDVIESGSANYDLSSDGTKTEVTRLTYDVAGPTDFLPTGRTQRNLVDKLSYSENHDASARRWFSYDDRGRLEWMAVHLDQLGLTNASTKVIEYTYHSNGKTKTVAYQPGSNTEAFYHAYKYDNDTRLVGVYTDKDPFTFDVITEQPTSGLLRASYDYYLHGPLKSTSIGGGTNKSFQEIDYYYTNQGWLKAINDPTAASTNDLFSMSLEYFTGDYSKSGQALTSIATPNSNRYDGLPKASVFRAYNPISSQAAPEGFVYAYDNQSQLLSTTYGQVTSNIFTSATVGKMNEAFSYDYNGNIQTLTRNDVNGVLWNNFTYTYDNVLKNRLSAVPGYASNFTYNGLGQLTSREKASSGVEHYTYNSSGLVTQAGALAMVYDDNGQRVEKSSTEANIKSSTVYVRDLSGNVMAIYEGVEIPDQDMTYTLSELPIYGLGRLGMYRPSMEQATYELSDHLGNVRVTFDENLNSSTGLINISDYAEYYAFGLEVPGRNQIGSPKYRYNYQGKYAEKDVETGLNHFQLREFDPVIGRWLSFDPYGQHFSPYVGMGNNPIVGVDPDGGWGFGNGGPKPKPKPKPTNGANTGATQGQWKAPAKNFLKDIKISISIGVIAVSVGLNKLNTIGLSKIKDYVNNAEASVNYNSFNYLNKKFNKDDHYKWPGPGRDLFFATTGLVSGTFGIGTMSFTSGVLPAIDAALGIGGIGLSINTIAGEPIEVHPYLETALGVGGAAFGVSSSLDKTLPIFYRANSGAGTGIGLLGDYSNW